VIEHPINKHEHDAWAAAYVLDPAFARYDEASGACYPLAETNEKRMERIVALLVQVTLSDSAIVRAEYPVARYLAASTYHSNVTGVGGAVTNCNVHQQEEVLPLASQLGNQWCQGRAWQAPGYLGDQPA
jgi:hypothetical protein